MNELEDLIEIPQLEFEQIGGMWYVFDPVTEFMGCGNTADQAKIELYGNINRISY